ncbi:hypothetical protein BKA70DRAFT_1447330 [Coprinopsis sp. MPI-PUGE-AT-0042]|nr:hypothetical protein BKA70DRAFT_1447330 [Coprinopsis sp. MPI-PUGE-AT-0042]
MSRSLNISNPVLSDVERINKQTIIEHAAIVLYSFLVAIQLCLSGYALIQFRRLTREQQQSRRRYVYFLIAILSLSLARFTLYLREPAPRYSPELWKHSVVLDSALESGFSFGCIAALSLLGDAFLVWRTTVIWSHNRVLKCIPIVLYIIYFGICVASSSLRFRALSNLIAETKLYVKRADKTRWTALHLETMERTQSAYQIWCGIEFAMSATVSVATTTLICIRLILLERKMKRVAAESSAFKSVLPYRQILALLLEATFPFTLVGVVGTIMAGFLDPSTSASSKAMYAFPLVTVLWTNGLKPVRGFAKQALGPQFIVFRIISGTTWTSSHTTRRTRPLSQPILFADDPVVSIITTYDDDEQDDQGLEESKHPNDAPGLRPRRASGDSIHVTV